MFVNTGGSKFPCSCQLPGTAIFVHLDSFIESAAKSSGVCEGFVRYLNLQAPFSDLKNEEFVLSNVSDAALSGKGIRVAWAGSLFMRKTPGFSHSGRFWDVRVTPGININRRIKVFCIAVGFLSPDFLKKIRREVNYSNYLYFRLNRSSSGPVYNKPVFYLEDPVRHSGQLPVVGYNYNGLPERIPQFKEKFMKLILVLRVEVT